MNTKFNDFLYESDLEGKRVRLIKMNDDPNPIEPGTEGTIKYVDGMKQLIVDWDNGRSLSLLPDVDEYIILNEELDAVTVGLVGSGTAVTGYPTGSFTTSAGQAVYGGDSGSAFANNSTGNNFKADSVPPEAFFKNEPSGKKNKKDKKQRLNNQIGKQVDQLDRPIKKAKNENMITKFKTFESIKELMTPKPIEHIARDIHTMPQEEMNYELIMTIIRDETELAKLLIEAGADVNATENGFSALMWATQRGHTEIAKMLIERGADVNYMHSGQTALGLAADTAWKRRDIAKLLIDNGAKEK